MFFAYVNRFVYIFINIGFNIYVYIVFLYLLYIYISIYMYIFIDIVFWDCTSNQEQVSLVFGGSNSNLEFSNDVRLVTFQSCTT